MLPFPKSTRIGILLLVFLFLGAGLVGYFIFSESLLGKNKPLDFSEAKVAKQDNKIKITPNTDIVQKIIYLKCNDEEIFRTKPADNLVGLNLTQVQKIYTGWNLTQFDTNIVEMNLKVDSFCREHANNMFLGVKDGYVAIYHGKPGPKAVLKEVTKIPVNELIAEDLEELQRGIAVHSREELLRILEGMQSR